MRVTRVADDFMEVDVEMKLRFWNQNYVRTHFGGSLYAMTDPFYMLMLLENLGREYVVWDKAATIRFKKPGRGTVRAKFKLTPAEIAEIKAKADTGAKVEPEFKVEIFDDSQQLIAEVQKVLYVRRKEKRP